jgi:hypothetical protein
LNALANITLSAPTIAQFERAQLRAFADVILAERYHPGELRQTLLAFQAWLIKLAELDMDSENCRRNIEAADGVALGPTWAALCVEDIARTRQFVRGTYQAVQARRSNGGLPVHVFYAGCGPFATLVLPLLTHFSEQQLRLSLVDINPISVACVQRLFARLNLQGFLEEVLLADAMHMKIAKPDAIDIVLSETMQRTLKNECQVQIMSNLMAQLPKHVLMLPERITLTLAQIDFSKPLAHSDDARPMKKLGTLLEFSKATIASATWQQENDQHLLVTEGITIVVPHAHIQLFVLTHIAIYGDATLELNESGLSTPEPLALPTHLRRTEANFHEDLGFPVQCTVRYVIDPKARVDLSVQSPKDHNNS